jgi:hypothetical protein
MIFSTDAIIAFSIMLLTMLAFACTLANTAQNSLQTTTNLELEEKTLMIADSMVKNYFEKNTLLGACITDTDKKRVKTNEINSANLKKAKQPDIEGIFVQKILFKTKTTKETIELEKKQAKECLTAKRYALIDGEKGIIETTICKKE